MAEEEKKPEHANATAQSGKDDLLKRKEEIVAFLKKKKAWLVYVIMIAIAWFGYYIRTRNIPLLGGKWLPDVDSYAFLRYAEYIAAHGQLMANDVLRYYPFGFDPRNEFGLLSYVIAYIYKILHAFNPNATVVDGAILYPALSFFVAAIFFFLFVKKMFNYKAAIVATAFLAVVPAFLYRTMAGVSDKEALAVAFFFAALYFYTAAMKSERPTDYIVYALMAGLATGLTGAVWGGVQFLFLTFGMHAISGVFFNFFKTKQIYAYLLSTSITLIILYLTYPNRYNLNSFTTSTTSQVLLFGFLLGLIMLAVSSKKASKAKEIIEAKVPMGAFAAMAGIVIGAFTLIVLKGPGIIPGAISGALEHFTSSFAESRWALTVAENHQPYFTDWLGQFSWKYVAMFMGGAVLLFITAIKSLNIRRSNLWLLGAASAVFFFAIPISRYSASAMLNGDNNISKLIYMGSLFGFILLLGYYYIRSYYQNKSVFENTKNIDAACVLVLIWFVIMMIAARSAIRLLFIFAPATAVLVGYLSVEAFEWIKKLKKDAYKIAGYLLLGFIFITTFYSFSQSVMAQASYVGPSFNLQWQNGMSWVKENTPENAVLAHWWDYGYWVQWGGNRATISDGGNAVGGINYFVGRHILTAQNETEALEFMSSRNVSYLLMISDEIGKYPAFSSIGADKNYDRYSWISTFIMQPDQVRETRDETIYLFTGGTPLDDDFIYQGKLFPAGSSGVAGVFLPLKNVQTQEGNETKAIQQVMQPEAVLVYNGQQVQVPLKCVYINGQEMVFNANEGMEGCLRVIPTIEGGGQMNPLGAALYLSPEVYRGLFAKLFLLNQNWPHIKLVYSDEDKGMPLALYQGRLIGPLKIWKVDYPEGLTIPPEYYVNKVPDPEVEQVRR